MSVRCARCGQIGRGIGACECGFEVWQAIPRLSRPLDSVPRQLTPRLRTGEREVDRCLGGGFPLGSVVLVSGARGSGKSRLCLRWASRWGALLVATEMTEDQIREVAPSAGVDTSRVDVLTALPAREALLVELAATGAQALVVDSVSRCHGGRPEAIVQSLIATCRAARVVGFAIVHESAKGRPRTKTDAEHDPDLVIRIRKAGKGFANVLVGKNRYAPEGSARVTLGAP